MANEITLVAQLQVQGTSNGAAVFQVLGQAQTTANLDTNQAGGIEQSFTAIAGVSDCGVTSPTYKFVKNISATGNLLLYLDAGGTERFATLKPGEGILIPSPAANIYAAASAGTVQAYVAAAKSL